MHSAFFRVCCRTINTTKKPPTFPKNTRVSRVIFHIYKRNSLWYDEYDEQYHDIMKRKGAFSMQNYVITITRQFGSRGRDIGVAAAKKLGIPLYDRNVLEKEDRGDRQHTPFSGGIQQKRHERIGILQDGISSGHRQCARKKPDV